jgi:hypothetical protein
VLAADKYIVPEQELELDEIVEQQNTDSTNNTNKSSELK